MAGNIYLVGERQAFPRAEGLLTAGGDNPAEEYHGLGKLCMVMRQSKNSKWKEQEKQGQVTAE